MDSSEAKAEPSAAKPAPKSAPAPEAGTATASDETKKTTGNKKKRSNPATAGGNGKQDGKPNKKKKKDTSAPATKKKKKGVAHQTNVENMPLVEQVMYRLTEGIPRMELKSMMSEADQCERELQHEIKILEAALKEEIGPLEVPKSAARTGAEKGKSDVAKNTNADKNDNSEGSRAKGATEADDANSGISSNQQTVDILAESPFTPLDKCFTLSALLGRLRDDLAIPSIRKPPPGLTAATSSGPAGKKKKAGSTPATTYPQLVALANHPNYTRVHPEPPAQLLHVWRKIASHRTAVVFRRPVKPEDAPGYPDRIFFPMDLSLVRKMIVARILTSYSEVHQMIRLISHNCVKYNGRESDYGVVAREFEAAVDEFIVAAVNQTPQQAATAAAKGAMGPTARAQSSKASGSGRNSPKSVGGGSGRSSPKNFGGGGSGRSSPKNVGGGSGRQSPATGAQQQAPSAAAIAAATAAAAFGKES